MKGKRLFFYILIICLIFTCCAKTDSPSDFSDNNIQTQQKQNTIKTDDVFYVYFSEAGVINKNYLLQRFREIYPDITIEQYPTTEVEGLVPGQGEDIRLKVELMAGRGPDVIINPDIYEYI